MVGLLQDISSQVKAQGKETQCLLIYLILFPILLPANADDSPFFLKDEFSVNEMMRAFDQFSPFSSVRPNKSKCEVAGIGVLNRMKMALCGMNFRLKKNLGIYF